MSTARIDFNVDDSQPSLRMLLRRVFEAAGDGQAVSVSLVDCSFLGPSAIVTLCGLRRSFKNEGRELSIEPPRHGKLRAYCEYSGLLADSRR